MDDWENDEKFDATTIKTVLPSVAIYPQPEFKDVKSDLEDMAAQMHNYAEEINSNPPPNSTPLAKRIASTVEISDTSTLGIPEGSILNTELVADFAKKGFTRFGCLMADTDAVSFMLAIQGKPKQADKGYQLSDTHLMQIWVNSSKFESRTRAIQSEQ
jgi:hypothetical protein